MASNPQTATFNPAAMIAASQYRSRFVPQKGGMLIVQLPGESVRCPVEQVLDEDTAIVVLDTPPISRMHSFRFQEAIGVRRKIVNNREVWIGQTERDFLAEQQKMVDAAEAASEAAKPKEKTPASPKPTPSKAKASKPPASKPATSKAATSKPATSKPASRKGARR